MFWWFFVNVLLKVKKVNLFLNATSASLSFCTFFHLTSGQKDCLFRAAETTKPLLGRVQMNVTKLLFLTTSSVQTFVLQVIVLRSSFTLFLGIYCGLFMVFYYRKERVALWSL